MQRLHQPGPPSAEVFATIDEISSELGEEPVGMMLLQESRSLEALVAEHPDALQLALYGRSIAVYKPLLAHDVHATMLIGHSVGEVAAPTWTAWQSGAEQPLEIPHYRTNLGLLFRYKFRYHSAAKSVPSLACVSLLPPVRRARVFGRRDTLGWLSAPRGWAAVFVALLGAFLGCARAAREEQPRAAAAEQSAGALERSAESIQQVLKVRAERLAERLTQTGPSLSSADECFSAAAAHPGLERAVLRAGCSAAMAHFEGAKSFSRAKFEGPVELQSATFSGDASFQWSVFGGAAELEHSRFQGAAEFYGALFTAPVGLFAAHFVGPAHFQGARFRQRADFTTAELRGGSSFYQAEFEGAATFRGAELLRDADFSSAIFRGEVDFSRARFGDSASFAQTEFDKSVSFLNAHLPACLDFSDVTLINEVIDLTKASPPAFGKKCLIDLSRSNLERINIDYERFKLDFPEFTSRQDRLDVYEGLLNSFKKRGLYTSFRAASIELEQYKYDQDGQWLISAIQDYWWDYGFAKERIFYWILGILVGFTIINNIYFRWLLENAYEVAFLLPYVRKPSHDEASAEPFAVRFILDLPLAFLYTSIIFFGSLFGFQRELHQFKSHRLIVNTYLFTIMALGIVCTMFIINFILK